jgi:hypothetical protein
MITKYKILGADGQEYEAVTAAQVKQWIAENRVEKKSPILIEGEKDWVFLESVPEFAEAFAQHQPPAAKSGGAAHAWIGILVGGLFGFGCLMFIIWLFVSKSKSH